MNEFISSEMLSALLLAAGADREGESRGLGISTIAFKVILSDPSGPFIQTVLNPPVFAIEFQ